MNPDETYTTRYLWRHEHDHTLVVDCSDPRITEARHDFLNNCCGVSRYDPIIVPGGPVVATLSNASCYVDHERIRMLHDLHAFRRVIGIVHFECGYYKHHHRGASDHDMYYHQVADSHSFRDTLATLTPGAKVEVYHIGPNADNLIEYTRIL